MKLYLVFIAILINEVTSKVLPDYIPQCKRKDPEFVKCVLAAVEKVKPYLLKGIPEIRVPPYEPLEFPKLTIDRTLEALRVKATLNKMKVHGASAFRVKNLKVDLNKYSAELKLSLPHLYVTSEYDVNGRLLLLPLAGKGRMQGNFTDCTTYAKGSAKIVEKKGKKVLQIDKFTAKVKVGGGQVKFFDKDGSNALIAETAANFFNGNPRLVLDIVNPIIEDTAAAIFTALLNRIFGTIPLSELILDD